MRSGGYDVLKALDCVVRFSNAFEFERDLDVGIASQRGCGGHGTEGGDGLVALFHLVKEVRQRHSSQVIARPQIKRQAKIDQGRQFIVLTAARAPQAVEHLRCAILCAADLRLQLLACTKS